MKVMTFIAAIFLLILPMAARAHGGVEHIMGTIKTIAATSLTVEVKDKSEVKILLDDKTKFEKDGAPATAKDMTVGTRVVVDAKKKEGGGEPLAVLVKLGTPHHGKE